MLFLNYLYKDVYCKVYSNGTVYATPPAIITTSCKLNINNYPFDQKQCKMTWGRYKRTLFKVPP